MPDLEYRLNGDTLLLDGLLSVETVSRYQKIGSDALIKSEVGLSVDLNGAEIIGSAAIALLIAWQRQARNIGKDLSVINAPQHFLDIASVSGVLDILPFKKSA
ncbi:MAG: ABC-type transporter Mla MlaB component [Candidatus Azotimanducaceae bacterium]|jgi:ABC-type transporter Mla MlaB component